MSDLMEPRRVMSCFCLPGFASCSRGRGGWSTRLRNWPGQKKDAGRPPECSFLIDL